MSPDPTRDELHQIATELTQIARTGHVLPGSLQQRHTYCGKPGCACQADPPPPPRPLLAMDPQKRRQNHHPTPHPDQIDRYRPWIENDRRIRELLTRLETLGIEQLETDRAHT